MRTLRSFFVLILLALAACSGGSSQTSSTANSALIFPGAKAQPRIQSRGAPKSTTVQTLTAPASFGDVQAWYVSHLPPNSEMMPPGSSKAVFRVGTNTIITITSDRPATGPTQIAIEAGEH